MQILPRRWECIAGLQWVTEHHSARAFVQERWLSLVFWKETSNCYHSRSKIWGWVVGEGPRICAQLLCYPPLDDRVGDPSQEQFENEVSDSESTICILELGMRKRWDTKDVSIYEAPERASWLDVRSEKIFRDETVLYGSKTWEHGGQVELHVWPRGWQTFVFAQLGTGESVP
jgi:hypothetical protein